MQIRKQFLFYFILLTFVLIVMRVLWSRQEPVALTERDYDQVKREGILRLVTEYNPSGYFVTGDTIKGFQYELSRAIARLSGLEVQVSLEMSLADSFDGLTGQKYDVIARNIPVTSQMKEEYRFTTPIVLNKQVLVQRTKANNGQQPIRDQLDLAKKTLYIPQNSPAILRIRHLEEEIGDTIYVMEEEQYSSEQLIIMVAKGDIDYAVCDQEIALRCKEFFPEIDIRTDISFTQLQSWAVRNDSPVLLDSLNSWLLQIRQQGLYDDIYKRYYQ